MRAGNPQVLATALLLFCLGHVVHSTSSAFSFADSCVNGCVGDSGCGTNDPKCMCKAAQGNLMETVLGCMLWHCGNELRDADNSFLGPLQSECSSIGKSIPQNDVKVAQKFASSLASKLGPAPVTTTQSPPTTTTPQQTTTVQQTTKQTQTTMTKMTTTTSQSQQTTSSTSSQSNTPAESTSSPTRSPTDGPISASSSTSQAASSTADAPNTDPTDSSPFAAPRGAASRNMGSLAWMTLPLAVVFLWR